MEILKKAKGVQDGEVVAWNENSGSVKEEVLRRNAKAGYSTKLGEATFGTRIQGLNFWGKQKLNVWPRDENGQLIDD